MPKSHSSACLGIATQIRVEVEVVGAGDTVFGILPWLEWESAVAGSQPKQRRRIPYRAT